MKSIIIDSSFTVGQTLKCYSDLIIEQEPMFFSASSDYAYKNGGPITKEFLEKVKVDGIFDSRVHMLMKGWYPAIPGWHHDDVPRDKVTGQPEYIEPEYKSSHILALVNGDICPTNFAVGRKRYYIPENTTIYGEWDKQVNKDIEEGTFNRIKIPSNTLVYFDWNTFHEGTQAVDNGWRWMGRLSYNTNRKIENKIRKQVQVYLEFPKNGW